MDTTYDLLIIGGGINGTGIARDAAGRGLRVLLVEKDDLAQHTSSASSKLIHGGLRYLEHFEFRLVAEALAEREVLLGLAPHIIRPLEFVMPHVPELRPAWMIRAGLFLYDHLGRRTQLPGSRTVRLDRTPYGASLKPGVKQGFVYSDCRVDDARLVVLNAMSAGELGATIRTHTECIDARRDPGGWEVVLRDNHGGASRAVARAVVNAAGPWVHDVLTRQLGQLSPANIKLVKGSHIVVPRRYPGEHAYILQNDDRRVVFMIPFERNYTLIGTTDIDIDDHPDVPSITETEINYLCAAANRYLDQPVRPADVVWSYSGVRPLYDDGESDPSDITRDYTLVYDESGGAPILSVFGGKITTYRRLAEYALAHFARTLPAMGTAWTSTRALPGGEVPGGNIERYETVQLQNDFPWLPPDARRALAGRHGVNIYALLNKAASLDDLGESFGDTLYAAEVDYFIRHEWALSAEDVLWRRTKCGLHMTPAQTAALAGHMAVKGRAC